MLAALGIPQHRDVPAGADVSRGEDQHAAGVQGDARRLAILVVERQQLRSLDQDGLAVPLTEFEDPRAAGGPSLLDQVEQVGADVLGPELFGRSVKMLGEIGDPVDLESDRLG